MSRIIELKELIETIERKYPDEIKSWEAHPFTMKGAYVEKKAELRGRLETKKEVQKIIEYNLVNNLDSRFEDIGKIILKEIEGL